MKKAVVLLSGNVDFSLTASCHQADHAGSACGVCGAYGIPGAGFAEARVDDSTHCLQHV